MLMIRSSGSRVISWKLIDKISKSVKTGLTVKTKKLSVVVNLLLFIVDYRMAKLPLIIVMDFMKIHKNILLLNHLSYSNVLYKFIYPYS